MDFIDYHNYTALLFDLDGTLWNANKECTEAWNRVLERLGYKRRITVQDMDSVTGKTFEEIMEVLLPDICRETNDIGIQFNAMEQEIIGKSGAFIFPGVKEKLAELSAHYKIFIVSNCQEWYLKEFLRFSGIEKSLSGWDCHGSSGIEKYRMISAIKTSHNIKDALYIGDTMYDQESAQLSGCDFIQMTYGFGEPIKDATTFDNFEELFQYLTGNLK
jgi:phosphoglycolate phosphatase